MLVSCICVCHNKPELAQEAIQSIVDQCYPHWEALVVDSGVLFDAGYYDRFPWRRDERVRLIRSEETADIRHTRAMAPWCFNQCFRKGLVRGELVMYLCDDDILYLNAFSTFVSHSRQNAHVQAMYASQDLGVIEQDGRRTIVGERRATEIGGRICNGRLMNCQVDYLQFCHKAEVLKRFPHDEYWPESKATESHADGIFMERVGEYVPIYPIDVKVSQNRRTPQSTYVPVRSLSLEDNLADCRVEALNWRQQYLLNQSFRQSLGQSFLWKLLSPVRSLRRFFRPRGFNAGALLPWHQLEPDAAGPPGAWVATGSRPYFLVPCELPAGWLRIRALLASDVVGRFEVLALGGNGIADVEPVFHGDVRGCLDCVDYFYVSRPMLGLQINPLSAAGRFQLKELEVIPVHRPPRARLLIPAPLRQTRYEPRPATNKQDRTNETGYFREPESVGEYPDLCLHEEPTVDWSIVIPTINDAQRVVKCITTCRQHLQRDLTVEFIVVDDGTHDPALLQELEQAAADFEFRLLLNHQNLGFSASVNHGMRHAQGRFIALCNNDILFFQPCLEAFTAAFDADPEVGILGARLLYPRGTLQHAGMDKVPGQLRWHHAFHDYPGDHSAARVGRSVWSVTGALMALRRETLQQLGGLSIAYATAYEDLDYCLHAWSNGLRVGYCPEAVAVHEECGTRGQKDQRPPFWCERERAGRQYFETKWLALREVESFDVLLAEAAPRALAIGP
jgi:GT2 family glycosyltransferase